MKNNTIYEYMYNKRDNIFRNGIYCKIIYTHL